METAREKRAQGQALGLEGVGLDIFVQATAHLRHAARVEMVKEKLRGEAAELGLPVEPVAIAIGMVEENGVGGYKWTGVDGGTRRHPLFSDLGKGRKLATDGPAWTAAIYEAVRTLGEGLSSPFCRVEPNLEPLGLRVHGTVVPLAVLTSDFAEAVCRRAIITASKNEVVTYPETRVTLVGEVRDWGRLLNACIPAPPPPPLAGYKLDDD